ncbi:MAG: gluconate 2-dehydrogenase subunit 3 family protein [Labilithrix sp.]|nr:gluconate 2-dehydrogenase subunit 3 family protein [Labilithrix sp.]
MNGKVSRRVVLKVLGAGSVLPTSLVGCADDTDLSGSQFFSPAERRALDALATIVIPSEPGAPGAAELGAAAFIERLLTAFDVDPPALFADGPFSGRQALPDGKGGAGETPPNDFARFRPIDRVTEKVWRVRLYGSKKVEGGALNEGIVPEVVGLRDLFRDGLQRAMAEAKKPIETMSPDELRDAFGGLDVDLRNAIVDLVPQAAFGAPEYGGNPGGAGWRLVDFAGDIQPLGYSLFDETTGAFRERLDAPMSTKDLRPDPAPMDAETRALLTQVVAFTGGKVFP